MDINTVNNVILFGNGGHAEVITDILLKSGENIIGFLCDDPNSLENSFGLKYLGKTEDCIKYKETAEFIVAIGDGHIRQHIVDTFSLKWHTAIHPSAIIGSNVVIGKGTVVMANSVINPCAKIGSHCIINTGSIIEHDCVIGDYTHLSPNACVCGKVRLGKHVWLGAGSTVINGVTITDDVIVGAGGCVTHNIQEQGTYAGVPAKRI